jgi:hypothetical protein
MGAKNWQNRGWACYGLVFLNTKAGRLHLGIPDYMCGYGRRLGRSRLSRQLGWNQIWNWCNTRQTKRGGRGRCNQRRRGKLDRCSASKVVLADLWSNSDFEFYQKVNAQNWTCHSGLQETGSEEFALKLNSFFNKYPRGGRLSIWPFEKGTR